MRSWDYQTWPIL